ncbi:MAG: hypothetical protein V8R14_06825, partial [Clostridia bacterium]
MTQAAKTRKRCCSSLAVRKKVAAQIKSEYAMKLFDEEGKADGKERDIGSLGRLYGHLFGACIDPAGDSARNSGDSEDHAAQPCAIAQFAGIAGRVLGAIAFIIIGFMAIPQSVSTAMIFIGA